METTKLSFDLGRVWQHYQKKNFGVLSAYLSEKSKKENIKKQEELKEDIRKLGYGFKEIKGAWRTGKDKDVDFEYALFVPSISKEHILTLGKKYNQFAVIYADQDKIILDKLGNDTNVVYTKMETTLKDSWISWSEYKRKHFRFAEVSWEFSVPNDPPKNWMEAMSLESFKNDKGISEYSQDIKRALLLNKINQNLKAKKVI